MRTQLFLYFIIGISIFSQSVNAQKDIILNEGLAAKAEQFKAKVRMFGDTWKIRFGDYSIISIKGTGTNTKSKSNFTGTKAQTKSLNEFSFTLGKGSDVAEVKAVNNVDVKSLHGLKIFPNFSVGRDELVRSFNHFMASININQDTADTWTLLIKSEYDTSAGSSFEGVLTNNTRKINVTAASSIKEGRKSAFFPALGYQFDENGEYLAAVQYYGGVLGMNRNIVWITKGLDAKFELVLAAAMTSILEFKLSAMQEYQDRLNED